MTKWLTVTSGLVAVALTAGASGRQAPARNLQPDVAELWLDPADLPDRDLMAGPGGAAQRPDADHPFAFVAHKTSGVNLGYDVRDAQGRSWSVKLGEEAQSEVTVSRLLWAIGFHQPVVYYLPAWTLTGTDAGLKPAGRFRLDDPAWTAAEDWSWYENPFVETQAFRGLIVAQFLLANWDLKTSNNRIYATAEPSATPRRRYVVRDLGASLGSARQHPLFAFLGTRGSQGTKNDIDGFERRGFIAEVDNGRVEFDYRGLNEELQAVITPADVVWTCRLLDRLTEAQWEAAFRAGDYPPDISSRYVAKIKQKIAEGLALETASRRAR
jgi:hypothetical protein